MIWKARETLGHSGSKMEAQALANTTAHIVLEKKALTLWPDTR